MLVDGWPASHAVSVEYSSSFSGCVVFGDGVEGSSLTRFLDCCRESASIIVDEFISRWIQCCATVVASVLLDIGESLGKVEHGCDFDMSGKGCVAPLFMLFTWA